MINYIIGDAVRPQCEDFKIIAYCIDDVGFFEIGFHKTLSEIYPKVKDKYLEWIDNNNISIGELFIIPIRKDLYIANLVGKSGIISKINPKPINYCALFNAMKKLDNWIKSFNEVRYFLSTKREIKKVSIHCSRQGIGTEQGNWEVIEPLMSAAWKDFDVYIYEVI